MFLAFFCGLILALVRILIGSLFPLLFLFFPYFYIVFLLIAYVVAQILFKKHPGNIVISAVIFVISFIFFDKIYYFINPTIKEMGGGSFMGFIKLQKDFISQIAPISVIVGVLLAAITQVKTFKKDLKTGSNNIR